MNRFAIFAAILLVTACANNQQRLAQPAKSATTSYWTKPDYTQSAFNSDRYQCIQSSIAQSQPNNSVLVPNTSTSWMQITNQGILFQACMQAKGYIWQTTTATHDPISDNLEFKALYCLVSQQKLAEKEEEFYTTHSQENYADLTKQALDETNYSIQKITDYLENRGIHPLEPNSITPDEKSYLDKATSDYNQSFGRSTAYQKCISGCPADNKYFQCFQDCAAYQNDKERRYMACTNLEKQLPTQ